MERALRARASARALARGSVGDEEMRARSAVLLVAFALLAGCGHEEEKASTEEHAAADSDFVSLSPEAAQKAGVTVANADSARIDIAVRLPGEVKADSGRVLV